VTRTQVPKAKTELIKARRLLSFSPQRPSSREPPSMPSENTVSTTPEAAMFPPK